MKPPLKFQSGKISAVLRVVNISCYVIEQEKKKKKKEENVGNATKTKQRNKKYFSSFPLKLVELEEGFDTSSSNL